MTAYIDGVQIETGSVATPYVDTNGSVATRLGRASVQCNEQDTIDDIAACVVAIFSTHRGWRDEIPEFGVPDLAFRHFPIGSEDLMGMIADQEPRAIMVIEERPGEVGTFMSTINVGVSTYTKGDR